MSAETQTDSLESFVEKASVHHGMFYSYPNDALSVREYVKIICPHHGLFSQKRYTHLSGGGCRKCGIDRRKLKNLLPVNMVLTKFHQVHGDRYDYSRMVYFGVGNKIEIICPVHGSFWQTPDGHVANSGCQRCSRWGASKGEREIISHFTAFNPVSSVRGLIGGKRTGYEIDIWFPDHLLGIEFCGIHWHSERYKPRNYHRDKMIAVNEIGGRLITVFEDEWTDHPDLVIRHISHALGKTQIGVGARKCRIEEISTSEGNVFLNQNHLQNAGKGSLLYGGYYDDRLIGVMKFGPPGRQSSKHQWELRRFATDGKTYPGLASRMFTRFRKDHDPSSVVTFTDLRWFRGDTYKHMGFIDDGFISPDYSYVRGNTRTHKSSWRKSEIRRKHPELSHLTESQATAQLGMGRIYDCGKLRHVWIKP